MAKRPSRRVIPRPESEIELAPIKPVSVPETQKLYRLRPVSKDLAQPHRQIALIAAETEQEARALATVHDPLGRPWLDDRKFACDTIQTQETHIVGDVVFKSAPAPRVVKATKSDPGVGSS